MGFFTTSILCQNCQREHLFSAFGMIPSPFNASWEFSCRQCRATNRVPYYWSFSLFMFGIICIGMPFGFLSFFLTDKMGLFNTIVGLIIGFLGSGIGVFAGSFLPMKVYFTYKKHPFVPDKESRPYQAPHRAPPTPKTRLSKKDRKRQHK